MTQEQALVEFRKIRPDARKLAVSRDRHVGYHEGHKNLYYLWIDGDIVASSYCSWEHALAIAKSANDDCWPEEDAVFEDEVSA